MTSGTADAMLDTDAAPAGTTHPVLTRTFDALITEAGDGRTIEARIVPYNAKAIVSDPQGDQFTRANQPYQEMFLPGAFTNQLKAMHRVKVFLNFEHQQSISAILGRGDTFDERDDGLYGTFRVYEDEAGDKALRLIRDGMLTGLSVEFAALKSRIQGGVVERVRAALDKVALCRIGAYHGAQVLAVRNAPLAPIAKPMPAALVQGLQDMGFNVPGEPQT